jgi:hypothetical protein
MSTRDEIENTLNRFMNSFDLKAWAVMASLLEPTIHVDAALDSSASVGASCIIYRSDGATHFTSQRFTASPSSNVTVRGAYLPSRNAFCGTRAIRRFTRASR